MIRLPRLVDNSLNEVRRITPVSCTLSQNIVPLSTATIDLPMGEKLPARSWVEIFTPKGSAGFYRTREPNNGYGDQVSSSVELEHGITELGDWLVREKIENTDMTIKEAIVKFMGYYQGTKWQAGNIERGDVVTVDANYDNILECLIAAVSQTPYMLTFDFTTSPWTFALAEMGQTVSAEGRLTRNVLSASIEKDDSQLATKAYAAYRSGNNELWVEKHDDTAISNYGQIEKKLDSIYENSTKANEAAQKYLDLYKAPRVSIEISGSDLSAVTGEELDNIEIGKKYRLTIPDDDILYEEIVKTLQYNITYDEEIPIIDNISVTLANENDYLIDTLHQSQASSRRSRRSQQDQDWLFYEFYSDNGYLHSTLEANESHLRVVYEDLANSLRGEVEQTASYWRSTYEDATNQLRGVVEDTAQHWMAEHDDEINGFTGILEATASYWRSLYTDAEGHLGEIVQTASYWRSTYEDAQGNLGQIEQTASYWRSTYENAQGQIGQIEQTASYWRSTYEDAQGYLGQIEQTASYWRSTYTDAQGNLGQIEQTASYWRSLYTNAQGDLGQIEQTASYWRSTYENAQGQLGVIEQTASYWRSTYENAQGDLGQIEQTASYWRSVYENAQGQMGVIEQTASYWRSEYQSAESWKTVIEQTASGWRSALSSVMSDGRVTAASIATAINNQGEAGVSISGDWIKIDGNTTLSGMLTITEGNLHVSNNLYIGLSGDKYIQATRLKLIGASSSQGADIQDLTANDIKTMITDASVDTSTNTLTLTKHDGTVVTFSKVGSINGLTGSWTGGAFPLTVGTSPSSGYTYTIGFTNESNVHLSVETNGNAVLVGNTGKYVNVPYKILQNIPNQGNVPASTQQRYSGTLALVNVEPAYNAGFDAVSLNNAVWTYPTDDPTTDNTGMTTNTAVVTADTKTDGITVRSKSIVVGLFKDSENKRVDLKSGGVIRARVDVSDIYEAGQLSVTHQPTASTFTAQNSEPEGDDILSRYITPDAVTKWYTFSASCGGVSQQYSLKVTGTTVRNIGYDADHSMFITGVGNDPISTWNMNPGEEKNFYPTFKKSDNSTYQYGSLVKVTARGLNLQSKTVNSSTSDQTVTADSGYDGLSSVKVNKYTISHSPVIGEFTAQSSDPGDGFIQRNITPDATTKWYKVTASCGGASTIYRVKVNGTTVYNNGYDASHSMFISEEGSTDRVTTATIAPGTSKKYYPQFLKKDGTNYQAGTPITVTASSATHSPTISSIAAQDSDPGSSFTQLTIQPGATTKWYKATASCGGESKVYRLYVNCTGVYNSGFDANHSMKIVKYVSSSGSYVSTTSESLNPGGSITVYPSFTKTANGDQRGTGATISARSLSLQTKNVTPTTSEQTISADSGYDGLSSVKIGAVSHSPVIGEFTAQSSDPGSSFTQRNITPDANTKWYKVTASCGGSSKVYRVYVNSTSRYYAGKSSVSISGPTYNSISDNNNPPDIRTVTFSTSGRTNTSGTADETTKSIAMYLNQAGWNGNLQYVNLKAGGTNGTIIARTQINAGQPYNNGYTDGDSAGYKRGYSYGHTNGLNEIVYMTCDENASHAAHNYAVKMYNANLQHVRTQNGDDPSVGSGHVPRGFYFPLADNYTITSNGENISPPAPYLGFRTVKVAVSSTHNISINSFDTTGVVKSSSGAPNYISGKTRANTGGLLTTGRYYTFQIKCGTATKSYYIET